MSKCNWNLDSIITRAVLAWALFSPWIAKFVFKCSWEGSFAITLFGLAGLMAIGVIITMVAWSLYYVFTGKDLFG